MEKAGGIMNSYLYGEIIPGQRVGDFFLGENKEKVIIGTGSVKIFV